LALWVTPLAFAQNKDKDKAKAPEGEEGEVTFEADDVNKPLPELDPNAPEATAPEEDINALKPMKAEGKGVKSWEDILVVMRKPFLKSHRLELLPTWGITINDNIIRHQQLNGTINFFLTDVLAVGVEGHLYQHSLREPFDLVARQARRLPTVNKYKWGAALDFSYVPVYGKFAILDEYLVHWETCFTLGIGLTESEVLPRDPALLPFTNKLITPNVGASMRFFITKYLTLNLGIRDYIFVDKFEPQDRTREMFASAEDAKANADSSLVHNIVFQAGIALWFPFSFEYTTFR
jgi:outer membrane beta-barrel protein